MPTISRVMNSIVVDTEKLDNAANIKVKQKQICNTFFLPKVSAINPQKCKDTTTPMWFTELSKPCCVFVMSKSHLAAGRTMDIFNPSTNIRFRARPKNNSR